MAKCNCCGKSGLFLKLNDKKMCSTCAGLEIFETHKAGLQKEISSLKEQLENEKVLYNSLVAKAKNEAVKEKAVELNEVEELISKRSNYLQDMQCRVSELEQKRDEMQKLNSETDKNLQSQLKRLEKLKQIYKPIKSAIDTYNATIEPNSFYRKTDHDISDMFSLTVDLPLNCLNVRDLRKKYKENERNIQITLERYRNRYTTKTNAALYNLMVIALEAELQNVLYKICYGKLDEAENAIDNMTAKYLAVAIDGNQTIAPTMKKFIGEIKYLFLEAVNIEYEYFVQKERIKEEQRALREQMRQEAAERKQLELQQKQLEKEESKYINEISSVKEQLELTTDTDKKDLLILRIQELEMQIQDIGEKKEKILNLQNGKAGHVYIISNLGSFGESVFKIGMTRRIDPQERVKELGNASVPFPFDVHSLIFSDDAVDLERNLHATFNNKRVNKVNLRKEFFNVSLDEVEDAVYNFQPTAEFNRTLLAIQYNQSLSIDDVSSNIEYDDSDDELDGDIE